jgi:hypothetical protein
MHGKCAVKRTHRSDCALVFIYIMQGFTNAIWKKSLSMAKCGISVFWLSSIILHCWKPLWTLRVFVKCAMMLAKPPRCFLFSTVKGEINILRSYLNCSTIVNWKTRKHTNTLKGSQRMGFGRIFLKTFRASLFNEDLSNEPNFGRIHLAGHYLQGNPMIAWIV